MTPVASGVANTHEDGFVFAFGLVEGLLAPRIPIYGILGVLQEVRAFALGKTVAVHNDFV